MMPVTTTDLPLGKLGQGKVRDLYAVDADRLLLVATDRVSAFDVVMAEPVPGKALMMRAESIANSLARRPTRRAVGVRPCGSDQV